MARVTSILVIAAVLVSPALAAQTFEADLQGASTALEAVLPECGKLMVEGDLAGANARLLNAFPEASRTPVQSFVLGNTLFEVDRKASYALHKTAAAAFPKNADVVMEWGLEQHRAGEYTGALKAYEMYADAYPKSASSYAMQADCLLRLNRVDEAVKAWRKSEDAPEGSIESMESLVCAVHRDPEPFARRAELLARVMQKHDVGAAADLIALDCAFPSDWWNDGPNEAFVAHDTTVVAAALKLPADNILARSMACAADCSAAQDDAAAIKNALLARHLLIDQAETIPPHGGLLSIILSAAMEAHVIDDRTLRDQIGPKILEMARKGHDPRLWNAAALTGPVSHAELQLKLEREGWQATNDPRFAAGVLFLKMAAGQLTDKDTDLIAAVKQFPESGMVQRAAYEAATQENKVTRKLLVAAARAEFTHFSSFVAPATIINRPRSNYLMEYFAQLERMPAK